MGLGSHGTWDEPGIKSTEMNRTRSKSTNRVYRTRGVSSTSPRRASSSSIKWLWTATNNHLQGQDHITAVGRTCSGLSSNQSCLSLRPCGLRAQGVQTHSCVKFEMEQFLGSIGSIFGDRTDKQQPQNDFIDSMQDLCGVSSIAYILLLISR